MKDTDPAIAGFYQTDCCCGCGSTGPAGPMGPQGPIGPQGPVGPAGTSATSRNAMRYQAGTQTVAAGETVSLSTGVIHSDGDIGDAGPTGLTLAPGQYLLGFTTDAGVDAAGELGAVFVLNGAPLAYTASRLVTSAAFAMRIALSAVLDLSAAGTVAVRNNTGGAVNYTDPVLTVVKLA